MHKRYQYIEKPRPVEEFPPTARLTLPLNFETTSHERLREFMNSWGYPCTPVYTNHKGRAYDWACAVFPRRPTGFAPAACLLWRIAECILRGESFDELFAKLPPYARWKRRIDVMACVAPGKKFRKNAAKKVLT